MDNEENKVLPPPVLLTAIVCERVIFDRLGGRPSLIDVLQVISFPKYPARQARLTLFCEMTNGHGEVSVVIRLVDVKQDEKVLLEQNVKTKFIDVRQVVGLCYGFEGVVFQQPGEYRFQIYAGANLLGERRIICRESKKKPGTADGDIRLA